jgi:hypothetical protein
LKKDGKLVLSELAKAKCKLIDAKSLVTKGIKIKNVLNNEPYSNLISNVNQNNSFDTLKNEIINSFNELNPATIQNIINNANSLSNNVDTFYFHQSITLEKLLSDNFFQKISEFGENQNSNNLAMMAYLNNCLALANNETKEILLRRIVDHTDHCVDQAITGLQLTGCLAIAYTPTNSHDNSMKKNIIAILVDLYKREMINRSLAQRGPEELEGVAYLTKYLGAIIFPKISLPRFLFTSLGIFYTENNGDPIKNLDKVLNRIDSREGLVEFICNGIYDGVAVGEMLFEEIAVNDQKYRSLREACEGKDFAYPSSTSSDSDGTVNYTSPDAKTYLAIIDENEADKFQQNTLEKRKNIFESYKKKKAEKLLKNYGYLY